MKRRDAIRGIALLAAAPLAYRGALAGQTDPTFELNINKASWPGWPNTRRVNMEYSNAHQHANGRQLEFAWAQHTRAPADHTSVRWTDFASSGAPTQGYYWPENDDHIWESDNSPSIYIPWKQWAVLWHFKVIDIGATPPAAIQRHASASACAANYAGGIGIDMNVNFDIIFGGRVSPGMVNSNYNPACLVNPDGNWTCWFGGGYFRNYLGGNPPVMKLIDDNPNFPATSTKRLRLRSWTYSGASPNMSRHAVKIGDWIYWGGAGVSDVDSTRCMEFYRIYVPNLVNSQVVTQERITDAPLTMLTGARLPCLAADVPRKRLILVNAEGVFIYQIPANDGPNGVWSGPFNVPHWALTLSDGLQNGITGDWAGFIGTHRSDLNQTFVRHNLSKRWARIGWRN